MIVKIVKQYILEVTFVTHLALVMIGQKFSQNFLRFRFGTSGSFKRSAVRLQQKIDKNFEIHFFGAREFLDLIF